MIDLSFTFPSQKLTAVHKPSGVSGVGGQITVELALATFNFTPGNGIGQINRVFRKDYTLAGAGTQILDLIALGGVEDEVGRPYALTKVKGLVIQVTSTDPTAGVIAGAEGTTAAWKGINGSETVPIADVQAGVPYMWFNRSGKAVTDTTDHKFKLENSHATAAVNVTVYILGSQ